MIKKIGSVMLGLMLVFGLAACANESVDAGSYYVAIDINPAIEFIVDENDNVVSFNLLNEDAEILVAGIDFIGMNIDEAVELFIQTATEAGYLDPECEDNAVLITVLGEERDYTNVIRQRIKERVGRFFIRNYIQGEVLTDEFTDEDLVLQAEELGVTPGKLSLALLIMETETTEVYVLEDLLEMAVKDLMGIVRIYHEESFQEYHENQLAEFAQKRAALMEQHEARFNEWVNNHPELTDEEIDVLYEQYKQRIRVTTRERWQNRINEWRENHPRPNTNEETDETQETS